MENATVMIVDDNVENLHLIGKILNEEGYHVSFAKSGKQALEMVKVVCPDLILLDVMMPEMDGFETGEKLKELDKNGETPIIFLTAKTEKEDIVKGFDVGAVDYITKPFNIHELLARVRTHLQLKFSQKTVVKQRNELEEITHILCHDLANPLHAITCSIQNAKKSPRMLKRFQTEQYQENLLASALQGEDIIRLVRELRSMDAGNMGLSLSSINLKEALNESFRTLESQFSDKSIQLIVDVEDSVNIVVEKISFVSSVINNLLTNAIKFSHPGSDVIVKAQVEEKNVIITIKDFGVGIPQQMQKTLFTINKSKIRLGTNGEQGTGFGMSLVKKFVTLYGGEIFISSKEESESSDEHGTDVKVIVKLA